MSSDFFPQHKVKSLLFLRTGTDELRGASPYSRVTTWRKNLISTALGFSTHPRPQTLHPCPHLTPPNSVCQMPERQAAHSPSPPPSSQRLPKNGKTSVKLTLHCVVLGWVAGDGQGRVPIAILADAELVLPVQGVALVAVVLDSRALGKAVAGGGVAGVAAVLWFAGWSTSYTRRRQETQQESDFSSVLRGSKKVIAISFKPQGLGYMG